MCLTILCLHDSSFGLAGEFLEDSEVSLKKRWSSKALLNQLPDHLETGTFVLGHDLRKSLPVIPRIHYDRPGSC